MSYFNKKKNTKIYFWFLLFILFCSCLFLIKSIFYLYQGEKKSRLNRVESETILNELKEKSNQISSEIEYLKTEKGIETELRDKFRVVKKGEQMAVIINSEEDISVQVTEDNYFWLKVKDFLKFW